MHPDLEQIVSADEEARARVTLEEDRAQRDLAAAGAERDATVSARRKEASDAFELELRTIREDGDRRVAELHRQQTQYLGALAETGDRTFERAVTLYLRVVCEVAS
jgi:hypothetical protein